MLFRSALVATLPFGGLLCALVLVATLLVAPLARGRRLSRRSRPATSAAAAIGVGALNGGVTVGDVESKHADQLQALVAELCAAGEAELGVTLPPGAYDRLAAYGRMVAHFPTAVKEFEWRNGWFYRYSLMGGMRELPDGRKIEMPDPTPMHSEYLQVLVDRGELDVSEVTKDGVKW